MSEAVVLTVKKKKKKVAGLSAALWTKHIMWHVTDIGTVDLQRYTESVC